MKLLIEIPTWLGDAVMATPAIENLLHYYYNAQITLIGSLISIEALKYHPKVHKTYVLDKKYNNFFKAIQNLESYDVIISFRSSFRSRLLLFFLSADKKFQFNKN